MVIIFASFASVITVIRKNHNRRSKMGLTSHLSNAYDTFSSFHVSFSLISSLTKISLMTSLIMMVLGTGLPENLVYLVCALFYFSKIPLIVFVDCHVMVTNTFVVSVEYFQSEYFPAQKIV